MHRRGRLAVVLGLALGLASVSARAAEPSDMGTSAVLSPLLGKLARHAERIEQMKKVGAYTFTGKLESLDRDGEVSETREIQARVSPRKDVVKVIRYTEDGKDRTDYAREKAKESAEKRKKAGKKRRDFHLPFLASEQDRYVFSFVERDAERPSLMRIAFTPKVPAEDAYQGSAWVDESTGLVRSMGFALSKNPTFVERVAITLALDLDTPLGPGPSTITVDGQGGFLFGSGHRTLSAA
jgi:hypothetical protein